MTTRFASTKHNADIYPPYDDILSAKKKCYPKNIEVTESHAAVPLQDLLDHTAQRLIEHVNADYIDGSVLELIHKWGCDGSSGHSMYRHASENVGNDCNLFLISLVPLKLSTTGNDDLTVWTNPRASSTRFCRPIKFLFEKETKEVTQREVNLINKEMEDLIPTIIHLDGKQLQVKHTLIFCMIDGKVCNSVTDTSSQTCYICHSTPKTMNDIQKWSNFTADPANFKFGLSTLHARIRFFECLLHISYRLDFKKWQVKSTENKKLFALRKAKIQELFRTSKLGLLVDVVIPGRGTTDDGNTARTFFNNVEESAKITGIDIRLIENFAILLKAMTRGHKIDVQKFQQLALETAELYGSLYGWFYMPATVHKILFHGADVIQHSLLPIGLLSEEAQEARNKDYKRYKEHHTRKSSRINTNTDLFQRLLLSSDPYISSIRKIPKKKQTELCDKVKSLLIIAENDEEEE